MAVELGQSPSITSVAERTSRKENYQKISPKQSSGKEEDSSNKIKDIIVRPFRNILAKEKIFTKKRF